MELPKDMSDKIMSMLKPKARPEGVLVFTTSSDRFHSIMFKPEILTEEERKFIMPTSEIYDSSRETGYDHVTIPKGATHQRVHAALMLGFRFQDDASRERWKKGGDFEMYRDAVNGIQ